MNRAALWTLAALAVAGGLAASCGRGRVPETEQARGLESREGPEAVTLATDVARRVGIRWVPARRRPIVHMIAAPAEIELDPDRTSRLAPVVDGRVERVAASVGDRVEAGATLAVIRSVAVGEGRAARLEAQAALDGARANLRRQEQLRAAGIGAQRDYDSAAAAERQAAAVYAAARARLSVLGGRGGGAIVALRSPIAGTILERHVTIGQTVGPGNELFVVADLSRVWAVGRVYERDVSAVVVGARARLTLEAYPGRTWDARIDFVGDVLDDATRTLPARMELANDEHVLRQRLFGSIAIEGNGAVEALAIPADSVQHEGDAAFVFVHAGEHAGRTRFEVRTVQTGRQTDALVEVRAGVREGDPVVSEQAFRLLGELRRGDLAEEE